MKDAPPRGYPEAWRNDDPQAPERLGLARALAELDAPELAFWLLVLLLLAMGLSCNLAVRFQTTPLPPTPQPPWAAS